MMKKTAVLLIFSFFTSIFQVKADEGMWLPMFIKRLNYADMQKKGLKLTAEEIYSVNSSSLKDAIVSLGGFCTGEMISSQGLMLTNHHCGYDAVQQFSSVEKDYLTDGFWAKDKSQELNVPGLTATFLVKMVDVTKDFLGVVKTDMTAEQKAEAIDKIKKELIGNVTKETHYTAYIKEFFYGNEYYMFVNETFNDVRLVGAPPESVGKYGGDTDNWMWPRHTGDFCMFRVYCGKDGKPAEYGESNVPFKPRHHLPVSIKGIEEGDFAMIMGYPGSTDRYLSSYGVKQAIDKHGPTVVEIRDLKLKTMKEDMDADKDIRLKYASKYAQTSNYWKYYIGQTEQLQTNNVYDRKLALENQFKEWIGKDKAREEKYGKALTYVEDYYKMSDKYEVGDVYALEAGLTGPEVFLYTYRVNGALKGLQSVTEKFNKKIEEEKDEAKIAELKAELAKTRSAIIAKLKEQTTSHFKDYNKSTDKKLVANLLDLYYTKVDKDQQPAFFNDVKGGNFKKYGNKLFCKSPFVSEKKMNKLFVKLEKGKEVKLKDDKAAVAANDLITMYFGSRARYAEVEENMEEGYRLFVEGIRLMQPNKSFYPNANSTQRLTYGTVGSYKMSDKVIKDLRSQDGVGSYYTTIDGLIEKEDATNPEFVIPAKLKELYKAKDYGQYADKKTGNLHVNFLTNNDITGGNSGSPVINGDGELIGTAFDGNWEAMSGDISFENKVQRTISVDIRYTLFIIDKLAGASHLIDEMTLVR
jgi:hypothetical protein